MVVVPCCAAELRGKQVATITEWLASVGMPEYAQRFANNKIDDVNVILRDPTDQDLKDIGVPLGHRPKVLRVAETVGAAPTQMQSEPEPKPQDDAERRKAHRRPTLSARLRSRENQIDQRDDVVQELVWASPVARKP